MKKKIIDIQELREKQELKDISEDIENLKKCLCGIEEVHKKYESYFLRFETLKKSLGDENKPLALPKNLAESIIIAIALKNYLEDTESEIEELEAIKECKERRILFFKTKPKKKSSKK